MSGAVVVLDIGKTNLKAVAFDVDGKVLAERSRANAPLPPDATSPLLRLDTEGAWRFFTAALKDIVASLAIEAISITTHGAAGALVTAEGLAAPPLDYEFEGLEEVADDYARERPPFEETLSPGLKRGLNLGRHLYYFHRRYPDAVAHARAFLMYPQYWSWRLTGVMASEVTTLGAHSDLWRPRTGDYSSMVTRLGWRPLFPPIRKAWETLGPLRPEIAAATGLSPATRVLCGLHDSNASLVPHLVGRQAPFAIVSTGTWMILMAVGGTGALDDKADMLANVNVRGDPVPCARFMGGREFSALGGDSPGEVTEADINALVAAGVMALPAFSDQGGPYAGQRGRIIGPEPKDPVQQKALANLYCALMTADMLERLEAKGPLIVEGGFAKSPAFAGVLAALMDKHQVVRAPNASGSAEGAAMLAHWGAPGVPRADIAAPPWTIAGLPDYARAWRAQARAGNQR
jgi:sugar (pentulose or hexulose) kinase